jgi:hypothetical protein
LMENQSLTISKRGYGYPHHSITELLQKAGYKKW